MWENPTGVLRNPTSDGAWEGVGENDGTKPILARNHTGMVILARV